ncbi:Zinc (Zn2)-Iron (Fe2) Permease (ZIP) Family [Phytophthora infestans T30-4]|uniref:Zinc (Zn2 )-Iron (Fe2 ) Permease (ZIP) Family n=1 Tax=Phytophthora infestans (strain T30-4) TaxID=403677 RepID=D0N481_PHYIT|nr:Zinc (Zn2)-Iron (Fe2) Permease (ZIP) Family [Phytophthora infestans T30-4]EEY69185.1 Zinc (Zn2)-Iron (Fe2) Permease (ZIP) Family [Phytophthora infestans T30-4]|eukprot:XP_002999039.1 Zinc (Zn2)-Iron (Fe2) Permease (ZIP) Family [Phytophthora infestans T30-4]
MFTRTALSAAVAVAVLASTEALENLKTDWDAYVSELPIPEVIDLTGGGAIDMQIGRATHNWTGDGSISGEIYGYSLRNSTPTMPSPTIKVAKGVPITITWYNELSQPHLFQNSVEDSLNNIESACYPYCGVPVVTHSQVFHYYNNQSASTKLYHDHSNGLTRLNTWAGLMGAYIIADNELEASINMDIETDIPLVLTDRLINTTGELLYSDDNCNAGSTKWVPESFGSVNLVNGVIMPYVDVPPAQVRFRLINVANARHYNISVPFQDKCQIRIEFVCDFTNSTNGTTYDLEDNQTADQPTDYDERIMRIRVVESLKTDTMKYRALPSTLVKYKSLKELYEAGGKERTVILGEMDTAMQCPLYDMIMYRSQQINMTTITGSLHCTKGTVEKWNFQNPTDDPHPFHWHLVNAQCGETEETIDTNHLKDVAKIPNAGDRPSDTITQVCYVACTPDEYLIANSTRGAKDYGFDTTEPYVAHCHILEHEENAMMSWFKIMDVDDGYADDNGITPGTEITNTVIATAMGMSVLGGIATTLSVLVISVERLKFLADPRSLSIAFALSAGVMIFIAFADLYAEALIYYRAAFTPGTTDPEAYEHGGASTTAGVCDDTCNGNTYLAATGVFFVGVAIILFVEWLVHSVFERKDRAAARAAANADLEADGEKALKTDDVTEKASVVHIASPVPGTPVDAARQELASPAGEENNALLEEMKVKEEYRRTGVLTGIAIAIHNFPEGLALFVSSLAGLRTGIVLSVGIILHNFPEGVAVAAPVYYATGSKVEAFKWTIISGFAQVLGAGIGWAAVSGGMSNSLKATLYALVAGMLVCITAKELLPGAYMFDPSGKLFVPSFFIGVAIIAMSLVALNYAGSS